MTELLKFKYFYIIFILFIILAVVTSNKISADQKIKITADEILSIKDEGKIKASGTAVAQDEKGTKLKSDLIIYDENQSIISAEGNIILNDVEGNTFFFEKLLSDDEINNFEGTEVKARLDDGSRIVGSSLTKKNNLSGLENAEYTPCLKSEYLIDNCPGWKLKANKIFQDNESKTIHYDHARIHLFKFLFFICHIFHILTHQLKKSGLLMPTVETDQNLGDTLSIPIFYNIKENLDLTFTPTIQSKSNNFYSVNYRHLNDRGMLILTQA